MGERGRKREGRLTHLAELVAAGRGEARRTCCPENVDELGTGNGARTPVQNMRYRSHSIIPSVFPVVLELGSCVLEARFRARARAIHD